MATEKLRVEIAEDMRRRSVAVVAREWGVTREAMMSFALGCESDGTRALIQARAAKK